MILMIISSSQTFIFWMLIMGMHLILVTTSGGLLRTVDGGDTWSEVFRA